MSSQPNLSVPDFLASSLSIWMRIATLTNSNEVYYFLLFNLTVCGFGFLSLDIKYGSAYLLVWMTLAGSIATQNFAWGVRFLFPEFLLWMFALFRIYISNDKSFLNVRF